MKSTQLIFTLEIDMVEMKSTQLILTGLLISPSVVLPQRNEVVAAGTSSSPFLCPCFQEIWTAHFCRYTCVT